MVFIELRSSKASCINWWNNYYIETESCWCWEMKRMKLMILMMYKLLLIGKSKLIRIGLVTFVVCQKKKCFFVNVVSHFWSIWIDWILMKLVKLLSYIINLLVKVILGGPAATFELYDPDFFAEFRSKNLIQAAIEFAQVSQSNIYDWD